MNWLSGTLTGLAVCALPSVEKCAVEGKDGLAQRSHSVAVACRESRGYDAEVAVLEVDRGLRSRELASVAEIGVENKIGSNDAAHTETGILNAACGGAGCPPSIVVPPATPNPADR